MNLLQNWFKKIVSGGRSKKDEYQGFNEDDIRLFDALEKRGESRVKDFLIKSFKKMPVSSEDENYAFNYFITNSVITAVTATSKASSVLTEFLYDRLSAHSLIDKHLLQCKSELAVKSRLITIEEELIKIIEKFTQKKENILIGNFGSGPGRDVIDVISSHFNKGNVRAINIDKDIEALRRGEKMAKNKGISHLVEFVGKSLMRYETDKKFDIILLIGVLCPLDMETCVAILSMMKKFLKKDGLLIASNATKKMEKEDPLTCHIMEWAANWKLIFKDEAELKQIFEKAGYHWEGQFIEPNGFHMMGMGTPNSI